MELYRNRKRSFRPRNWAVERIAFDGLASGFGNQANEVMPPQSLGGGRSCIMVNLFLAHGAVDIIGPKAQRNLRDLRSHHLPVRLNVREIIEDQPAHRNLFYVEHAGRRKEMLERCILRVKCQRDESLETA